MFKKFIILVLTFISWNGSSRPNTGLKLVEMDAGSMSFCSSLLSLMSISAQSFLGAANFTAGLWKIQKAKFTFDPYGEDQFDSTAKLGK